tara:strand:+ start:5406 stop:5822 length:417 start_codon:yes stop_codon:yes gene_type:complete
MAVYATDDDLVAIVPDIFDHGVDTFDPELINSSGDIERRIKSDWWNTTRDANLFDTTKLKASEWKRATIYHSLAYYILPRLSNFQEDDTFQRQMTFYKERYMEEFSAAMAAGISYDHDGDGVYGETEKSYVEAERLYR